MKRKLTVFVLCFSLITSLCMIGSSAEHFTDVSSTSEYLDAINYVSDNSYMGGTSSTEFSPTGNMNRAMFATVLYRYATDKSIDESIQFSFADVATTAWYYDAARWAHNKGYMSGTSVTTFSPTANITRQDAATVLYRYAGMPDSDGAPLMGSWITDCDNVPDYARPAILWAAAENVMSLSGRHFRPTSVLSRQEMAEAVVNYGVKVKGLDVNTEGFGFANEAFAFFEDGENNEYFITQGIWRNLMSILDTSDPDDQIAKQMIIDEYNYRLDLDDDGIGETPYWNRACFGMSSVVALDKIGKIDFNTNFAYMNYSFSNMNDVDLPKNNYMIESGINYYHFLQFVPSILSSQYAMYELDELIQVIEAEGMVLLGVSNYMNSHMVVAYDVRLVDNPNYDYRIYVYDPDYPNVDTWFNVDTDYGSLYCDYGSYDNYYSFTVYKDWDCFDRFDIDGVYNSVSYAQMNREAAPELLTTIREDFSTLYFSSNNDVAITNDRGEKLLYSDGKISGDMEIIEKYICYAGATGAEIVVEVANSSSFDFEFESEDLISFKVLNDGDYSSFRGTGIGIFSYDDGVRELSGDIGNYCLTFSDSGAERLIRLSGADATELAVDSGCDIHDLARSNGNVHVKYISCQEVTN